VEFLVLVSFIKGANGSISARKFKVIRSNLLKCFWVDHLARSISAAGEKHAEILGHSNCKNFISVNVFL
jgi:hypothetical protein